MTDHNQPDDAGTVDEGPDEPKYPRYAEVTLADAAILIYDRDNEDAWIESSVAHALSEAL